MGNEKLIERVGFIRAFEGDHKSLEAQHRALKYAKCHRIVYDISPGRFSPAQLESAIQLLNQGEMLIVRSIADLNLSISRFSALAHRFFGTGRSFSAIEDKIDTSQANFDHTLFLSCLRALAEFEHDCRTERARLAAETNMKRRNRRAAHPPDTVESVLRLESLRRKNNQSIRSVCREADFPDATYRRIVRNNLHLLDQMPDAMRI